MNRNGGNYYPLSLSNRAMIFNGLGLTRAKKLKWFSSELIRQSFNTSPNIKADYKSGLTKGVIGGSCEAALLGFL